MKVKQYFVNEIIDLKSEINALRLEVAKRDSKIELLERNEIDFKSNLNKNYGVIGAIRELISNNLTYDGLTGKAIGVAYMVPDDFNNLLELLDIQPYEPKNELINCHACKFYECPNAQEPCNSCRSNDKFEPKEDPDEVPED